MQQHTYDSMDEDMKLKYSKILPSLMIVTLTIIAIFLRLYRFPSSILWQDAGMELLRVFHIVQYGEYPLVGVPANTIQFFHPPWYLYIWSMAATFIPSIPALLSMSVLFHALAVLPVFFITTAYFGISVGFIAASIYALYPPIVQFSYSLQSQNIILPTLLFTLVFWVAGRGKKWHGMSIGALIFATTVNYASWLVVICIGIADIYRQRTSRYTLLVSLAWWAFWTLLFYAPLLLYSGFSGYVPQKSSPHLYAPYHFIILAPFVIMAVSWIVYTVYKHTTQIGKIILLGISVGVMIYWIYQVLTPIPSGDYEAIQHCVQKVTTDMEQENITRKSHIVVKDLEHTDQWDYLVILAEQRLHQPLVRLGQTKNAYHWIYPADHLYLMCMDGLSSSTCDVAFTHDYPTYVRVKAIDTLSLPCHILRFDRIER